MWTKSYSTIVKDINARTLWNVWTDVNNWDKWQDDIEFAKIETPFHSGSTIKFRPKGGPTVNLHLVEVETYKVFTDLTKFPLAKMYDKHEVLQHADGIEVKTTISISGPLAFLWKKLVAEKIVKSLPEQTASLINRTRAKL
jgi:hypothetical protein